jgi:hypothetical protein
MMVTITDNPAISEIANEVTEKLAAAMASLKKG